MTGIRYLVRTVSGVPVVTAPEEIDIATADQLSTVLLHVLSRGHATAVIDMTGTRFCDSAGLHALLGAHKRAREQGGELRVAIPAAGLVPRLFELTCAARLIPVFASVEQALARAPAAPAGPPGAPGPDSGQRQAGG